MSSALERETLRAFSGTGPLAQDDPHYAQREVQQQMASAVAQALVGRHSLVVEAGTGVGKTFAYLVPVLLSGQRALVSTATKGLQDQLYLRDLPALRAALGVQLSLALLKGRGSYLCLLRMRRARESAELPDRIAVRTLARVEAWARSTRTGDLAELEGLDDRSPVIPLVTSTRDNCLGTECPDFKNCHVVQARREAMLADVVVVNHHLFFADLALRDSGVAELLPTVDAVVFDEAHQLTETGVQFLGSNLATAQVADLTRDALAAGLAHARGLKPWAELCAGLQRASRDLRLACGGPQRETTGLIKLRWPSHSALEQLVPALAALAEQAQALAKALLEVAEAAPDFAKLAQRAAQQAELARQFNEPVADARVRWIDITAMHARLVESPLDIADMLTEQREQSPRAWVFTSATLGDDDALTWFTRAAGLADATTLRLGSPFAYAEQARLWVPAPFVPPNDPGHPAAVGALASRLAARLNGRTFVLTTTLRALQPIAQALLDGLAAQGKSIQVLVQGTEPRRTLLQRFRSGVPSVLVGSQSFWEGIDVPGDALQCVLIDKLPFPPPNDPLVEARVRQLRALGESPFDAYFVAEAAVSLKQGAGRLIRSEADRGLLVIADARLRSMGYGKRLIRALPPMQLVQEESQAMAWLEELASAH